MINEDNLEYNTIRYVTKTVTSYSITILKQNAMR